MCPKDFFQITSVFPEDSFGQGSQSYRILRIPHCIWFMPHKTFPTSRPNLPKHTFFYHNLILQYHIKTNIKIPRFHQKSTNNMKDQSSIFSLKLTHIVKTFAMRIRQMNPRKRSLKEQSYISFKIPRL